MAHDWEQGGSPLASGERVAKQKARYKDGKELASGHNSSKNQCPKALDCVQDKQLACTASLKASENFAYEQYTPGRLIPIQTGLSTEALAVYQVVQHNICSAVNTGGRMPPQESAA